MLLRVKVQSTVVAKIVRSLENLKNQISFSSSSSQRSKFHSRKIYFLSTSLTFCWLKRDLKIESAWPLAASIKQHFFQMRKKMDKKRWDRLLQSVWCIISLQNSSFMLNLSLLRLCFHLLTTPCTNFQVKWNSIWSFSR